MGLLNSLTGLVLANVGFSLPVTAFIIKGAVDAIPSARSMRPRPSITARASPRLSLILLPLGDAQHRCGGGDRVLRQLERISVRRHLLARRGALWPASVGLASFIGQYETPMGAVMGSALVFSLPAIVFFLLIQRKIVAGLTSGAVKG